MPTFKVLLEKRRPLKDGTFPLVIRVYSGDVFRTVNLKMPLRGGEFDEKTERVLKHPNRKEINQKIIQTLAKLQEAALKMEMSDEIADAKSITNKVLKPRQKLNFLEFGKLKAKEQRDGGHYGNSLFYDSAISALKTYAENEVIQFRDVTYQFLLKLENNMKAKGVTINGIAMYMRTIRAIYNKAIKEKLIDRSNYPFEHYRIKMETTAKRNISKEDIRALMALELEIDSPAWHARNYFILCFNLIGISFADLVTLKKADISNGRLTYRRKKTHKIYNIKLTEMAKEIMEIYEKAESIYVLPEGQESYAVNPEGERRRIIQVTHNTNRYLKEMGEKMGLNLKITTYVARHSWATIAKRMGYSKDLIAEALGHEFGNKVTGIYLDNFDQDVIDQMNEAVCKLGLR